MADTLRGMSATPFDVVIRGGTVIDPASGVHREADVAILGGRVVSVGTDIRDAPARHAIDATGCLVVPGLIDLHAHVYASVTPLSVDADPLAARSGTATHVDAGSAGAATFDGFRRFIVERSRSRVMAFLNISLFGLAAMPECEIGRAHV